MKFSLPHIATQRPIAVTMLVITLIGLGVIAAGRMSVEFMPPMDMPFLGCFIPYPGATPAQVEQEIAIPAEGEFRTLSNLDNLYTSSSDNRCFVRFNFKPGTDMTATLAEVRDRIERLRLVLPQDVDRIFIQHFNSDTMPIMNFALTRDTDEDEFGHLVRTALLPKLERLPGVAEVRVSAREYKPILVEFDQNALRRHNLAIYQVVTMLQTSSFNMSLGELTDGNKKYLVRTRGEFRRPEEMAELVIAPGLRLKDVAEVGFRSREETYRRTVNGKKQVFMTITKESEANTVATCLSVHKELERVLATPAFEGARYFIFFDQSEMILTALNGLRNAGMYGGLLALCVLFVFLRRTLPTIVVALAIPGSLVAGLIVMFFMGMTLNMVTMISLIIAVGIVVDNSIVVVENIYRYRALGYSPIESARRGASEVSLAITTATLTTAVVFVPVIYMDAGQMSVLMRQFAVPVSVALWASLLIALTVIPLAASKFGHNEVGLAGRLAQSLVPASVSQSAPGRLLKHFRPIHRLMAAYTFCLRFTMRNRFATLLMMAAVIAATYFIAAKGMGLQDMPSIDRRTIDIRVNLDPNYDMAMTREVFDNLEAVFEEHREELGVKDIYTDYSARGGTIELYLKSAEDYPPGVKLPYTSEEVMNIVWELLPERFPGGRVRVSTGQNSMGGSTGQARVSMRIQGDDSQMLDQYADRLIDVMKAVPSVSDVDKNTRPPEKEIQLKVDEVLADRAGISSTAIAQTVGFAISGVQLPEIREGGREIFVWAQFREEDRQTKANLDNVMLQGEGGALVALNELVTFEKAESPQTISRMNGKNYVWVTAKTASENLSGVRNSLQAVRDSFELPIGYELKLGDELRNLDRNVEGFKSTLLLAMILIFIVMAALFESCLLPLSILTTVPLAFIGVFWMMYLTNTSLDSIAFIGSILMAGVVVNNGIVIVDHINNLRKQGLGRHDAIMQAGRDRIRPVLMTAMTTILAAVPLAIGGEGGRQVVVSLGRALIGGLSTGTILTLFIVPLFYTLIDDLQAWTAAYLADLTRLGKKAPAAN